ncbi:MAG TPA: 50S ribosomal protein L4 [Candidatus Acidoferrales bacterium]
MPVVDVMNLEGKKVGQLDLADDVFGVKINQNLLHEAVRHHLAGERAGTHKTKDKSEVSGSGKKLWKQKGTGRARVGSVRSPLWRHGGTVHGPVPRSYDYALPKKMILGALRSALSAKFAEQKLTVVDGWELDSHKTKPFRQALGKLNDKHNSFLIVESGENVNLDRASRNIAGVTLVPPNALEPYDLMRHEHVMLSREAVARLTRSLSATAPETPVQIQAAPAAKKESAPAAKPAAKAAAKSESKAAAKKPAAKKETKSKPKAKKG